MPKFKVAASFAYKMEIFIGGDYAKALDICQDFCSTGLCVTVEPTMYVYRGGRCEGVRVGLINYARFPSADRNAIWQKGEALANILLDKLGQGSYTIQDDVDTIFYTERPEDGCNVDES